MGPRLRPRTHARTSRELSMVPLAETMGGFLWSLQCLRSCSLQRIRPSVDSSSARRQGRVRARDQKRPLLKKHVSCAIFFYLFFYFYVYSSLLSAGGEGIGESVGCADTVLAYARHYHLCPCKSLMYYWRCSLCWAALPVAASASTRFDGNETKQARRTP
jgi:hypothetical protein